MLKVLKGQGEIAENLNNLTDAVVEGFDNIEDSLTRLEGIRSVCYRRKHETN